MVPKFPQGWWEQLPWPWGTSCSFPSPGKPTAGMPYYGKHEQFILVPKLKSLFLNWSSQFLQEGNLGLAPWTEMSEGLCRCWVMPKEHGTDREPDPSAFPCSGSPRPAGRAGPRSPRAAPAVAVTQPWFLCPNTGN